MTPDEKKNITVALRQVHWEYQLDQYTSEELIRISDTFGKVHKSIIKKLESGAGGKWTRGREKAILKEIDVMWLAVAEKLSGDIEKVTKTIIKESLKAYSNIVSFDGRVSGANMVTVSPAQLNVLVKAPLGGKQLKSWVEKIMDEPKREVLKDTFLAEAMRGDNISVVSGRIADAFSMTRRQAETLALTYFAEANNAANKVVFDANSDIIKKERWNACLEVNWEVGRGTCLRCGLMDGREWPLDVSHPRPPLHPRCRCFMSPVTASYKELGLDIGDIDEVAKPYVVRNKDVLEYYGLQAGDFKSFIKDMPDVFAKNWLGPTRYDFWKSGKYKLEDFIDKWGNVKLLSSDRTKLVENHLATFTSGWDFNKNVTVKPVRESVGSKKPEPAVTPKTDIDAEKLALDLKIAKNVYQLPDELFGEIEALLNAGGLEEVKKALDYIEDLEKTKRLTGLNHEWQKSAKIQRMVDHLDELVDKKFADINLFESHLTDEDLGALPRKVKDDVFRGYKSWVGTTTYGNYKNGRTLKQIEELIDDDNPLIKHGWYPRTVRRRSPPADFEDFLVDVTVENKALKRGELLFHNEKYVADRLEKVMGEYDLEKVLVDMYKEGRIPEWVLDKFDFENNYYIRRGQSFKDLSWDKDNPPAPGELIDYGYSSFAGASFEWPNELYTFVEIPKKDFARYYKENVGFVKLDRGNNLRRYNYHLPNSNEQEIVAKNYYELKTEVYKDDNGRFSWAFLKLVEKDTFLDRLKKP